MEKVHIHACFKIKEGKLPKLKLEADQGLSVTKNEAGDLLRDLFVVEEKLLRTVIETSQDPNAVLAHVGNVDEPLFKPMEIPDFSGELFGNASTELSNALKEMNRSPVPFEAGI